MTKTTNAASAASFLGTKADKPKSRKPAAKVVQEPQVAAPTSNLAAQLAAAAPASAVATPKPPRAAPESKLVIAKEFKPRTNHVAEGDKGNFAQKANWDALVAAEFQAHGGAITYAEAVAAVEAAGKAQGYEKTCNARGFVQGRVRNGHVKVA